MNKKELFVKFIRSIEKRQKLTLFISRIFDYDNFNDYNYLFRMKEEDNQIIIDIYDNVSVNRFNRYIFIYDNIITKIRIIEDNNVFVTYLPVLNINENDCINKLIKLAYLFGNCNDVVAYAKTFLDDEFVDILIYILKK